MSRSSADIVKQGYVKVKSKNLGKWNKRWLVLRSRSIVQQLPVRLEKYRDEVSAFSSQHAAVYDLTNLTYINRLGDKHRICVILSDYSSLQFAADSDLEADNWLRSIELEISGQGSSNRNDMFEVYLMKTSQLPTYGECLLQVADDSIKLLDIDNPRKVQLSWTLQTIRRYSIERGMFTIEVGRASVTGEGLFMFDSKYCDVIFDRVDLASRALASRRSHSVQSSNSHGMAVTSPKSLQSGVDMSSSKLPSPERDTASSGQTDSRYSNSEKFNSRSSAAGGMSGGVACQQSTGPAADNVPKPHQQRNDRTERHCISSSSNARTIPTSAYSSHQSSSSTLGQGHLHASQHQHATGNYELAKGFDGAHQELDDVTRSQYTAGGPLRIAPKCSNINNPSTTEYSELRDKQKLAKRQQQTTTANRDTQTSVETITANDEGDVELSQALQQACRGLGLESMIVDKIELI